jgi:cytochrome c oxidase subunit 3
MKSLIYSRRNPYYMLLGLALLGSMIIFVFITITWITRKGHINPPIRIPAIFNINMGILLISSLTLWLANREFNMERYVSYTQLLGFTIILAGVFTGGQLYGWHELQKNDFLLQNNMNAAFIYILSGLHLAHILLGGGALVYLFSHALKNASYVDGFIESQNPVRLTQIRLTNVFWHFIGGIWLVIYLFILYY